MRIKMPKLFSEARLDKKIQMLFLGLMLGNVIFLGIFLGYLKSHTEKNSMDNDRKVLDSSLSILYASMENINVLSKMMMQDQTIHGYFMDRESKSVQELKRVQSCMYNYIYLRDFVGSAYLFDLEGVYTHVMTQADIIDTDADLLRESEWRDSLDQAKGRGILAYNGGGAFTLRNQQPVLSYARAVYDVETQKKIGYLSINLNEKIWQEVFQQQIQSSSQGVRVEDQEGNCLYEYNFKEALTKNLSGQEADYGQRVIQGGITYNLLARDLPEYGFRILFSDSDTQTFGPILGFVIAVGAYLLFSVILWILVRHVVLTRIVRPIEKLVVSMDSVQTGWLHRVSMKTSHDEIGQLKDSYNQMLVEINRLFEDQARQEEEKYRLELELLQEQMNPHFLYNTLYTIENIALKTQDMEVCDCLQSLGSFYRNFLSKGRKEVTVAEEFQIIRDYLKLQKLRFEDDFEAEIQMEDQVRDCPVLRLILQPLVENSINHGIRPKGELCSLLVAVHQVGDQLHFTVRDTGIGMSQERIEEIFRKDNKKSFGLKATVERIRLHYGREDVCEIHSQVGEYTEILLKIPCMRGRQDGQED